MDITKLNSGEKIHKRITKLVELSVALDAKLNLSLNVDGSFVLSPTVGSGDEDSEAVLKKVEKFRLDLKQHYDAKLAKAQISLSEIL